MVEFCLGETAPRRRRESCRSSSAYPRRIGLETVASRRGGGRPGEQDTRRSRRASGLQTGEGRCLQHAINRVFATPSSPAAFRAFKWPHLRAALATRPARPEAREVPIGAADEPRAAGCTALDPVMGFPTEAGGRAGGCSAGRGLDAASGTTHKFMAAILTAADFGGCSPAGF